MPDISDNTNWFETDNANDRPPPAGWPEGQAPSTVNDCARAMMGAIKRFWDRINPSEPTITPSGALWQYNTTDVAYPTAYVEGEIYSFLAGAAAAGADQFQVNSLGAKPIYRATTTGPIATVANDWVSGAMPSVAYRTDLNAGSGGWLLLSSPYLPITSDGAGDINFPGNVTFAGNVGVTGALAVTGGVVFTSTLAVGGHVGLSGGLGVVGSASIDNLTITNALAVDGSATVYGGINVAGGVTIASGGLTISAGSVNVNGSGTYSGNFTASGNGSFAGTNILLATNGISYFGGANQIAFVWDSGGLEVYINRSAQGPVAIQNTNPVFANLTISSNLAVGNQLSANSVVANAITSNGNLNVAGGTVTSGLTVNGNSVINGQDASDSIVTGPITCSAIAASGDISSHNNQVYINNNGIEYFGSNAFAFQWAGAVQCFVDRGYQGYLVLSSGGNQPITSLTADQITGTSTDWVVDFFGGGAQFRVFVDAVSDRKFKKNIHDTKVDALAAILATPVREFEWKVDYQALHGDQPVPIGLVAQEVKEALPGVVVEQEDTHWVNLKAAVPYLIRAVQQLTARVAELEGAHA